MATVTATLGLTLPIGTEKVSRAIINGNMQLIDSYAASTNQAITALNNQIANIGTITEGTNASSLAVLSATETNICSMTLQPGTYIITAGFQFGTSYNGQIAGWLKLGTTTMSGTTVRTNGGSGGGIVTTWIGKLSSVSTINLVAYQGSGSSMNASYVLMRAVRVA